jgi:hypothetical protein
MRAIFDRINAGGWAELLDLRGQPEGPHLEAKRKEEPGTPKLSEKDRSSIAKAVSGMANADGGCLLFGVHAGPDPAGIDRIHAPNPIEAVDQCLLSTQQAVAAMLEPPISLCEVERVLEPGGGKSGIVLVYVPASDGGPHRVVTGPGEGRYYLRAGSNTEIMPHTTLADRFGRSARADLQLQVVVGNGAVRIGLHNRGRGSARQPAFILRTAPATHAWADRREWDELQPRWHQLHNVEGYSPDFWGWRGGPEIVVYPTAYEHVVNVALKASAPEKLRLHGTIYCLDAKPRHFDGCVLRNDKVTLL